MGSIPIRFRQETLPDVRRVVRVALRAARAQANVRVDGPRTFNTTRPQVDAALAGLGVVLLPEDELLPHIDAGRLVCVLADWCPKLAGYHLYYPRRRQPCPAFSLVVQALRLAVPSES